MDGNTLVLSAPTETRAWVAERFDRLLQSVAQRVIGPAATVLVIPAHTEPDAGQGQPAAATAKPAAPPPAPLNPKYTFEQFVIGDSNRLAHAACLAVAELPGLAYNPLYLCGPPGLGKTHLLHSIANYLELYGGGITVRYVTGEAYTNHFLATLHGGGDIDAFKAAYRDVDVLLVDDVQFLERKVKTEEEFFHTINTLHTGGAQLVLTSDRPPRDLQQVEERLRERFASGLVCELTPPDQRTRRAILRKRVSQDELEAVESSALDVLAERLDDNIRVLEGALIRLVAYSSLTGRTATDKLANEVLDGLYDVARPRKRSITEIQERTAAAFGIAVDELVSPSRAASIAWARQVAMYLTRELTDQTLPAIGRAFGGRNHSTVINACKRAAARIAEDPDAHALVQRLTDELRGH